MLEMLIDDSFLEQIIKSIQTGMAWAVPLFTEG